MLTQDNNNREQEIFKDIPGYEGMYQVSNQGRVKSFKCYPQGKILRLNKNSNGYYQVILCQSGVRKALKVHILVMLAFVGERLDEMEVNHKDGIKTNNHVDNLEYCTSSENRQHAYDTGLQVAIVGEKHESAKLTQKQVLEIRTRYKSGGITQMELAREYCIDQATISKIVNRKLWSHI